MVPFLYQACNLIPVWYQYLALLLFLLSSCLLHRFNPLYYVSLFLEHFLSLLAEVGSCMHVSMLRTHAGILHLYFTMPF